jgi:hypothetical protein
MQKMVSKSIDLGGGLRFASIGAGKQHFERILKSTALGQHVTAQEFDELKTLYDGYCRATNWTLVSPPTAFFPQNERGPGYTTRCFGIKFEDGSTGRFSLDKALSAVAR